MIELIEGTIEQKITIRKVRAFNTDSNSEKIFNPGPQPKTSIMQTGNDAMMDPSWVPQNQREQPQPFGATMNSVSNMISPERLWGTAIRSPKGHFLVYVMPVEAYKNQWKFKKYKDMKEPVSEAIETKLKDLTRDYNIRKTHTLGTIAARGFGQALVYKIPNKQRNGRRKRVPVKFRVHPIRPYEIYYNELDPEDDHPTHYKINVRWGRGYRFITIQAEDAVLYVHKKDLFGNDYQGIPETFPAYNQLKWQNNVEEGFAQAMSQRGISMLHLSDPDFDIEDIQKYKDAYGNPATYNVLFTDDEMQVENIAGNTAGFNLLQTSEAFSREIASASGVGVSRLDGTQRGQVTGSQTDQDNYYSILNAIQEENDEYLIELYEMLDPSLIGQFDIDYVTEPKLDKQAKANITSVNAANVIELQDYLTYNQSLTEYLDQDPVPGGDIIASKYIRENIEEEEVFLDEDPDEPSDDSETKPTEKKEIASIGAEKSTEKKSEGDEKLKVAQQLLDKKISYKIINEELRERFNEGYSNTTLSNMKKKTQK